MHSFGIIRAAGAIPRVKIADPRANADAMLDLLDQAAAQGCDLVVFPELSLTGYTCADLFHQQALLLSAREELLRMAQASTNRYAGAIIVGLPIVAADRVYNCAAVIAKGRILGLVPKTYLPNYREFYEQRWFSPASGREPHTVRLSEGVDQVPFGTDLLFAAENMANLTIGVEICEDLWTPIPPSSRQCLAGATVLVNLSASNESTGKADYRRGLVANQSGRCVAAYIYSASGVTESTTDLVFGGHAMIAENGALLAENPRFGRGPTLLIADLDLERLTADRLRLTSFAASSQHETGSFRRIAFRLGAATAALPLRRPVPAHPFVPADSKQLADRCEEIFQTQMAGLAQRIESARPGSLHIGVSGGLDSTLALLVAARTCDLLSLDRQTVRGLTMPGFGTSKRTFDNAQRLMQLLGVRGERVDIRHTCLSLFCELGHQPFGIDPTGMTLDQFVAALAHVPAEFRSDLVFENVQARARTMLLMSRGFVVGTGDLSELALGWCTYNGDHMSMYNPNAGIPKTLVRFLVRWAAEHQFTGQAREVLLSIADTEISPELLPVAAGEQIQSTEQTIGPYELHDFFMYHVLRFGFAPPKIVFLAEQAAFDHAYSPAEIRRWLELFYRRFFASQFKRSCVPDGPKVGSVSLSPRGDWRMPSDAQVAQWVDELNDA